MNTPIETRLDEHIDGSTKPDWRELAEASDKIHEQAALIETLKEALREIAIFGTWTGTDEKTYTSKEGRIARTALADGGKG